MSYIKHFKKIYSTDDRIKESERLKQKYPNRIPIILDKDSSSDIQNIDKHKYLVPDDYSVGQFLFLIRKRIKINDEQALFLYVNNFIPPNSSLISQLFKEYRDKDGFLYIIYQGENVFG
jgi:GABA(A) receptor-associated protein